MNGAALAKALMMMRDAYPRQPFGDGAVRVYAEQLADLDGQDVLDAVERLLRTLRWMPTIAEIREEVAEGTDPLPTVEEAWDQAQAGRTRSSVVRESVEAVGGFWSIAHGDNQTTIRAQFRADYTARRAREMRARAGGEPVRAAQLKSAGPVVSLNGHRLKEIPESTRIMPRPVMRLLAQRLAGHPPELHPTSEEKHDAILILEAGPDGSIGDDPLYREAEAVMVRANDA